LRPFRHRQDKKGPENRGIGAILVAVQRHSVWPGSSEAHRETGRTGKCRGHVVLVAVVLLLTLAVIGCALINRFVFTPKKGILVTPARSNIPYREVWFPARDGVQLNGWYIGGTPGVPLVLFFHGNAGNLSDNLQYIALLHGQGFPIFIFDYRGYGKSAGEPVRENDLYQDARGAVAYLEGRGWHHEAMIYFGQSLGAAVALQTALETPPAGLVMESSFTCMSDIVRHLTPVGYYMVSWWGIDMPFDNAAKIQGLRIPLLMIHGDEDPVAPVEMTRRLFALAAQPKMLQILSKGGHCDAFTLNSSAYLAAWNSYLQALPAGNVARKGVTP
jgi:uncharacterized protein